MFCSLFTKAVEARPDALLDVFRASGKRVKSSSRRKRRPISPGKWSRLLVRLFSLRACLAEMLGLTRFPSAATMEMYWNSEPKVATNVFELGLKMFGSEPDYILRYLDFLLLQNNANSEFCGPVKYALTQSLTMSPCRRARLVRTVCRRDRAGKGQTYLGPNGSVRVPVRRSPGRAEDGATLRRHVS